MACPARTRRSAACRHQGPARVAAPAAPSGLVRMPRSPGWASTQVLPVIAPHNRLKIGPTCSPRRSGLGQRFPHTTEDQRMQSAEIPREEMPHTRLVQDWLAESYRCGPLSEATTARIQDLPLGQLEALAARATDRPDPADTPPALLPHSGPGLPRSGRAAQPRSASATAGCAGVALNLCAIDTPCPPATKPANAPTTRPQRPAIRSAMWASKVSTTWRWSCW